MNQGQSKPNLKRPNPFRTDNILESVRGLGASVGNTVQQETTQNLPDALLRDMFGTEASQGELQQNESIALPSEQPPKTTPKDIFGALTAKDKSLTEQEIGQLRAQLATLAPKTNDNAIKKEVIEQPNNQTGIYHKNRLERFIEKVKNITADPFDGLTWFRETGKRKKQKGFWGSYKKHGTTFGLSSERTASTQSG